jgi:hypothetical protein
MGVGGGATAAALSEMLSRLEAAGFVEATPTAIPLIAITKPAKI